MDKKGESTYIRLRQSSRERISDLARKLGGRDRSLPESDLIDAMVALGLDTYEFYQAHFGVFPVGFNLRTNGNKKEDEDC